MLIQLPKQNQRCASSLEMKPSRPQHCRFYLFLTYKRREGGYKHHWQLKHNDSDITHRIHEWYIFTYIYHKIEPNVGEYSIHGLYGLCGTPPMIHVPGTCDFALYFRGEQKPSSPRVGGCDKNHSREYLDLPWLVGCQMVNRYS